MLKQLNVLREVNLPIPLEITKLYPIRCLKLINLPIPCGNPVKLELTFKYCKLHRLHIVSGSTSLQSDISRYLKCIKFPIVSGSSIPNRKVNTRKQLKFWTKLDML
ncbi:hypothetical protein ACB094_03G005800 [Castanea mollissima]